MDNKWGKILLFFLTVFSFLATVGCGSSSAPIEKETETKSPSIGETLTTVTTALAQTKNFEYLIQSNGKVLSAREQLFIAETSSILVMNRARPGNMVASRSVIAQLETSAIQYRLEKAELTRFNSEKEYQSQLLGYENLLKNKTKAEADDIKQKLKISTGLAGAEQDIKEANHDLSKAVIKAPFTGVIADVEAQQGQQIKAGQELFRIYDPYNLLLEVKALETDVHLLKKGTPAVISPIGNQANIYKAAVSEINPYVDENGMVQVRLKIIPLRSLPSPSGEGSGVRLFPGMNCTATIKIPLSKILIVPKEAVVMRNGKAVAFTLEDGLAKWNYVTVGRENGKEVEIKNGLGAGQKVITSNNLQLAHDAPVKEVQ